MCSLAKKQPLPLRRPAASCTLSQIELISMVHERGRQGAGLHVTFFSRLHPVNMVMSGCPPS